jgi:hypothetical protein
MLNVVSELKSVQSANKQHFSFEDLQRAMLEFGVPLKRPPFLAEKQSQPKSTLKSRDPQDK